MRLSKAENAITFSSDKPRARFSEGRMKPGSLFVHFEEVDKVGRCRYIPVYSLTQNQAGYLVFGESFDIENFIKNID